MLSTGSCPYCYYEIVRHCKAFHCTEHSYLLINFNRLLVLYSPPVKFIKVTGLPTMCSLIKDADGLNICEGAFQEVRMDY